jgi:protein-L-isoaspartate(D-aspartate) O-methyltransferase
MPARLTSLIAIALLVSACRTAVPAPDDSAQTATAPAADSPSTSSPELQTEPPASETPAPDPYAAARFDMVRLQIEARGVTDPAVLDAMRTVPRHRFVPDGYLGEAYDDHALPIGFGQTISQPLIVALMTELLALQPGDRVLEIGTGSGYQAAVLAQMGMEVYTVEIIPELAVRAEQDLAQAGYDQIQFLNADGYSGWQAHAPYDAIIVTAAPDHLPQPLTTQLAEGGRLVIPIGPIGAVQSLWLFQKIEGEMQATNYGQVLFVPFTREGE